MESVDLTGKADLCGFRVIKSIHGKSGGLGDIQGVGVGNGNDIRFWVDKWVGGVRLCDKFPRLYHLDSSKECKVAEKEKWVDNCWCRSGFCVRNLRGRVCKDFEELQELLLMLLSSFIVGIVGGPIPQNERGGENKPTIVLDETCMNQQDYFTSLMGKVKEFDSSTDLKFLEDDEKESDSDDEIRDEELHNESAGMHNHATVEGENDVEEGFDKYVERTWNDAHVIDSNAMKKLMKKMKYLKEKIRAWIKVKKDSSKNIKKTLKAELAEIDLLLDKGEGDYDILNKRMSVSKLLHDLNKWELMEMSQKAKIK
ncbi:hypothetical protein Tco_0863935 [Tanacetum coccineum]